ncbi:MAG: CoA-binding protein [Bdellovibrionales bacterium]|nr:CoA-binding protein [Bdellovibrionales bacterium]
MENNLEAIYEEMLSKSKTIAVVGISDKSERSSYGVAEYLSKFYNIIPINPNLTEWNGIQVYPSLDAVPRECKIDLIDVFRKSEYVSEVVDQAINNKIPYIWMQLGVINQDEAERAESAGIKVVMDVCIAVIHNLLKAQGKLK